MTEQQQWELEQVKRYEAELWKVSEILQRKRGCAVGLLCCAEYLEQLLEANNVPDYRLPECVNCGDPTWNLRGGWCPHCAENRTEDV